MDQQAQLPCSLVKANQLFFRCGLEGKLRRAPMRKVVCRLIGSSRRGAALLLANLQKVFPCIHTTSQKLEWCCKNY